MKLHDWFSRLVTYVDRVESLPFAYGRHDCAINMANLVEAQTGIDLAAAYRGAYASLGEGLELLREAGLRDHLELVERNFEEVPVSMAQNGDIAVFSTQRSPFRG